MRSLSFDISVSITSSNVLTYDLVFFKNELCHEKTNNVDSNQVWHKPGCTGTEDG